MKVKGAQKVHLESGPNMTPLVDVVMVILIFLMLAGSFGGAEHYLASSFPASKTGVPPASNHKPFEDTQVDLRIDGSLSLGSAAHWTARFGNVSTSDPTELKRILRERREQYNGTGTPTERLQVIIDPNSLVQWQSLIQVYQSVMGAGFTKIAFSGTRALS